MRKVKQLNHRKARVMDQAQKELHPEFLIAPGLSLQFFLSLILVTCPETPSLAAPKFYILQF